MKGSEGFSNSPLKNMKFDAISFDFGVKTSEYNWKTKRKEKNDNVEGKREEGEWREEKGEREGITFFFRFQKKTNVEFKTRFKYLKLCLKLNCPE
jgi:hypothetical protein